MKSEGTAKLVRIFLGESDRWKGQPLHVAIVEEMRKAGLAGATVFKGILGFGATRSCMLHGLWIYRRTCRL
jgi:PII-like signaling protein